MKEGGSCRGKGAIKGTSPYGGCRGGGKDEKKTKNFPIKTNPAKKESSAAGELARREEIVCCRDRKS